MDHEATSSGATFSAERMTSASFAILVFDDDYCLAYRDIGAARSILSNPVKSCAPALYNLAPPCSFSPPVSSLRPAPP